MNVYRTWRHAVAVIVLGGVMGLSAGAQQRSSTNIDAIDRLVGDEARAQRFSGTVLVGERGRVLLSKGYGLANREWDVPNTPDTKFRIGSLTKQFTAAAILKLQEAGALSVADRACQYLDACPEGWRTITVHQLLTHTGGIPNRFVGDPTFASTVRLPLTPAQIVAAVAAKPLSFVPGTEFGYSNSGYIVLGLVIERAAGAPYSEYLRSTLFAPLGMTNTGYDDGKTILPRRASGYRLSPTGAINADFLDMAGPFSAGSLYSTTEDLFRWTEALYGGGVVSKGSLDQMLGRVPGQYYGAFGAEGGTYGYGLIRTPLPSSGEQISHSGGIFGFNAYMRTFTQNGLTVIALANAENVDTGQLTARIVEVAAPRGIR